MQVFVSDLSGIGPGAHVWHVCAVVVFIACFLLGIVGTARWGVDTLKSCSAGTFGGTVVGHHHEGF